MTDREPAPSWFRMRLKGQTAAAAISTWLCLLLLGGERCLATAPVTICHYFVIGQLVEMANVEGDFAKEGLAVTLLPKASGRDALNGLLAGECDLATVADTPIVMMAYSRPDFRIVATTATDGNLGRIIARSDAGIGNIGDLRGKRVGIVPRTSSQFFLYRLLIANGVDPDLVSEVPFDTAGEAAAAFRSGVVDAVSLWEPFIGQLRRAGGGKTVEFGAPGLVMIPSTLVASLSFLATRQSDLRALLRALLAAEASAIRPAVEAIARRLNLAPEDLSASWASVGRVRLSLDQSLLLELEDESRWAVSKGLVDAHRKPNYLNLISADALTAIAPGRVTFYR